jgi:diadenosine tetraphosphate (Ap4A) HIT family hydrolase
VVALADGFPVTEGHMLVVPRRHVADYFDLTERERMDAGELLWLLRSRACKMDKRITGFNVGVNVGASAGQTVMHCHIHLIPRRDGDMDDPRGGVRGVIPARQKYR